MPSYFFDFKIEDAVAIDDEGVELSDTGAAHDHAVSTLAAAFSDVVLEGATQQRLVIGVRDEMGPVLEISAVFDSKILRTQ